MKKAINFDIDTKKYKQATNKSAPSAYREIRGYLTANGFAHRQGSGYVSVKSMTDAEIYAFVSEMSRQMPWLAKCVREIDITNVGKFSSAKDALIDALIVTEGGNADFEM